MGGIDADAEERKAFVFDPFREEDEQATGSGGQQARPIGPESSSSCMTWAVTSTSSMLPTTTTPLPTAANAPASSARAVRSSTTSSSKSSSGFSLLDLTAALPPRNIVLSSGIIRSGAPSATSDSSPTSSLFPDIASGGGSAFSTFGSGSSTGSNSGLHHPPHSAVSSNASTALLPILPMAASTAMNSLGSRTSLASLQSNASRTVPSGALPGHIHSASQSSSNALMGAQGGNLSKQPSTISFNTSLSRAPTPVAGYRVPATGSNTLSSFPLLEMCGPAFKDKDGKPIYVVSAILGNAVHPAKAGPHLAPPVRMSFGGVEKVHDGRYDLLPITSEMKWVKASHGRIPDGYTPVQGGYEDSGQQLYHALAKIEGHWVPGKTGLHLLGGNFPYHHQEVRMIEGYRVLCWAKP